MLPLDPGASAESAPPQGQGSGNLCGLARLPEKAPGGCTVSQGRGRSLAMIVN